MYRKNVVCSPVQGKSVRASVIFGNGRNFPNSLLKKKNIALYKTHPVDLALLNVVFTKFQKSVP